jgi:tetratricopeptide (TPR) repeat protein
MGDYAAALELRERLSRRVRSAADVRELLGLAAARAGQSTLAESYLKRLTGARAAEAYRTLCADAVIAQELERAEYFLEEARQRDDGKSGQITLLSESIDGLRRRLRQPLEEALERLFAAGDLERAAESARQCLDQWPDSRAARSILDKIEDRRTQEKIQVLTARAREALQRHAYADALEDFQRALGLGCSPQELGDDLMLAQREAEKQNEREQLEALRRRLTDPDPSEGLLAYLSAKSALRARIRAEFGLPVLEWLEQMGAASSGSKARMAVEGVLALEQALEAMERGSVEHAANLLSQHDKVIADLSEARQAWETIEQMRSEARQSAAHQALAHARQAMQEGRSEEAIRLLDKLDQRALSAGEQKQVADWLHDLRQQEEHRTLRKRIDSLLAEGRPLAARRVLDKLIEVAAEGEKQALLDERRRLTERIDREWRVPLELAPFPTRLFLLLNLSRLQEQANSWLLTDREGMVVAHNIGPAVLVCLLDPVAGTVSQHVLIADPKRREERPGTVGGLECIVQEGRAALIGPEGDLLELELDTWCIRRHERLERFLPHGEGIESVYYCPWDRFCWIESSEKGVFHTRIIDLDQRRERRAFSSMRMRPIRVVGARGLFLVKDLVASTQSLYTSSGKWLHDYPGLTGHTVVGAVVYEKNNGSIALLSYDIEDDENDFPLIVSIVDQQGAIASQYKIVGSYGDSTCSHAVLGDSGEIFVLYSSDQERRLLALKSSSKRLTLVYDIAVPGDAILVCNETLTQVRLVVSTLDAPVQILSLGGGQPELVGDHGQETLKIPRLAPPFFPCSRFYSSVFTTVDLPKQGPSIADSKLLKWVEKRVEDYNYNPPKLTGLVKALIDAERNAVLHSAVAEQLENGKAGLLWVQATVLLEQERWDEAIRILRPALPAVRDWSPLDKNHTAHLLGVALYRSGRIEEALTVWRDAGFDDFCNLQPCIDLAACFVQNEKDPSPTAGRKLLHALVTRLEKADRHLQAKNYRAAIETLDCPLVWAAKEEQTLARLSDAFLQERAWSQYRQTPEDNFVWLMTVSSLFETIFEDMPQLFFPDEWSQDLIAQAVANEEGTWESVVSR